MFSFFVLELECKVLRRYYIELTSVLFIDNMLRYFLSEFVINHEEFDRISDGVSQKDKSINLLNIIHQKMKDGDTRIFMTVLNLLHFYGNESVHEVTDKMRRKLFELRINKRSRIEQRMNDRIAGTS